MIYFCTINNSHRIDKSLFQFYYSKKNNNLSIWLIIILILLIKISKNNTIILTQNNNRDLHFKIAHFFFFFFFYLKHPSNIMQNIFVFLHTLRLKNSKIELAPLLQGPQFRVFADSSRRKRNKRIPPCLIICLPPSNVIELPSV